MSRNIPLAASLLLNALLALWLINNYFYDQPFRDYVQLTLSQIYPFLIVSMGIGGGSGLGYLFLKRKQHPPSQNITGKLSKTRFPRAGVPVGSTGGVSSTGKGVMASPNSSSISAGQIPRQVAYQVPPPIISKSVGSSKSGLPTVSWSGTSKSIGSTPPQITSQTPPILLRRETQPSVSPVPSQMKEQGPVPPGSSITGRVPGQPWRPETGIERASDQGRPGIKPVSDFLAKPQTQPPSSPQIISRQQIDERQIDRQGISNNAASPVPQKWHPVQNQPGAGGGGQPGVTPGQPRQEFDPSQKWTPIRPYPTQQSTSQTNSSIVPPQQRPLPPNPTGQVRPVSPGAFAARPMPQGIPRPPPPGFQQPGQPRPGILAPVGVPRPFRPENQNRPGGPAAGGQPGPFPPHPVNPSQWTGPAGGSTSQTLQGERQSFSRGITDRDSTMPGSNKPELKPIEQQPQQSLPEKTATQSEGQTGTPGSDMDWDTALDTILKTLRRDRIRDEQ